jgi:hypothetical protein
VALAAGIAGFRKEGVVGTVVEEALRVASTERFIAATEPLHRHDQAVLSLLAYKHLGEPVLSDGLVYAGWESPRQAPGQKVWVHRRALAEADRAHFSAYASGGVAGEPHMPAAPEAPVEARPSLRYRVGREVYRLLGRSPADAAVAGRTVPYDGVRD